VCGRGHPRRLTGSTIDRVPYRVLYVVDAAQAQDGQRLGAKHLDVARAVVLVLPQHHHPLTDFATATQARDLNSWRDRRFAHRHTPQIFTVPSSSMT